MIEPEPIQMAKAFLARPTKYPNSILRYFQTDHLHPVLAVVADEFKNLAEEIDKNIPDGPEKSVCLRRLLEAKEAAVRASVDLI